MSTVATKDINKIGMTIGLQNADSSLLDKKEDRKTYKYAKRAFDVAASSLLVLTTLSWLYPLAFILIKLGSKGPAIFIQKRVGLNGGIFSCYKFRTMRTSSATSDEHMRITGIGRILRKTHIDELPQLINVLMNKMSIVGPRPHMLSDHDKFSALLPWYNERHIVKPGITGLAQSLGHHGYIDNYHGIYMRTRLDLFYTKKASPGFDIKIIIDTLFVILRPKKLS